MLKKGTKLYAVAHLVCPRCQEEKLFDHPTYDLKHLGQMRAQCSHCGLKYSIEPGFFYGAAYVSYALTVALAVAAFVATYLFYPAASASRYVLIICLAILGFFPLIFALSRAIWLNMFVKYDPAKSAAKT